MRIVYAHLIALFWPNGNGKVAKGISKKWNLLSNRGEEADEFV
jgi:hypothetical protein